MNLEDFPQPSATGIGGLEFNNNPLICGGYNEKYEYQRECFSWRESVWQKLKSLPLKTAHAAFCQSPYPQETHKLIMAGGFGDESTGEHF